MKRYIVKRTAAVSANSPMEAAVELRRSHKTERGAQVHCRFEVWEVGQKSDKPILDVVLPGRWNKGVRRKYEEE